MASKRTSSPSVRQRHRSTSLPEIRLPIDRPATLEIYDTTLRDGAQAEDVSFSAEDKVRVAQKLDELGVHFIEGGWPGANPKDIEFFRLIKTIPFKHATVIAFGSTRKASQSVHMILIYKDCWRPRRKPSHYSAKHGPCM